MWGIFIVIVYFIKEREFTLDIDAMEIEAGKREAVWTYKGNKGYMPILGFIQEIESKGDVDKFISLLFLLNSM